MNLPLLLLTVFYFMLGAEMKPPPTIPDSLMAKFYKAQAQLVISQAAIEKANSEAEGKRKAYTDTLNELMKACGDGYTMQANAAGDPSCVVKPATPAKPAPPVPAPKKQP